MDSQHIPFNLVVSSENETRRYHKVRKPIYHYSTRTLTFSLSFVFWYRLRAEK